MDGATVTIAGDKDFVIPIYRDILGNSLLDNWGKVGKPQSFPQVLNGKTVPGVEYTVFTVQLTEGCKYVGPTDTNKPASSPKTTTPQKRK